MMSHRLRPLATPLTPPPLTVYPDPPEEKLPVCVDTPALAMPNDKSVASFLPTPEAESDRWLLLLLILLLWESISPELLLALCYILL